MDDILRQYDSPEYYGTEKMEVIPDRNVLWFPVQQTYKFKGFIDIGADNIGIVMEDQTDKNLSFLRISDISP